MIIFMLLFLHFRRKKVALPPEVKSLIESMPSKPVVSLPQRRNSLSGPATPSKERTFGNLQSGGGLQRFSSETALGVLASWFLFPCSAILIMPLMSLLDFLSAFCYLVMLSMKILKSARSESFLEKTKVLIG